MSKTNNINRLEQLGAWVSAKLIIFNINPSNKLIWQLYLFTFCSPQQPHRKVRFIKMALSQILSKYYFILNLQARQDFSRQYFHITCVYVLSSPDVSWTTPYGSTPSLPVSFLT